MEALKSFQSEAAAKPSMAADYRDACRACKQLAKRFLPGETFTIKALLEMAMEAMPEAMHFPQSFFKFEANFQNLIDWIGEEFFLDPDIDRKGIIGGNDNDPLLQDVYFWMEP